MVPVIGGFTCWVHILKQRLEGKHAASCRATWNISAATPLSELQTHTPTMQDYIQLGCFSAKLSFKSGSLWVRPANSPSPGSFKPPLDAPALPHSCDRRDFNHLASYEHQITICCCRCFTCLASFVMWCPLKPAVIVPGCARHKTTLSRTFSKAGSLFWDRNFFSGVFFPCWF